MRSDAAKAAASGGDYHTRFRVEPVDDPARIDRTQWNALVAADPDANVFLRHEFLQALTATGCAVPRAGWGPHFLTLWRGKSLAAAAPMYAKSHSFGEYVFDWGWADAYERSGRAYYPKWLVAVPFTPVGGTRLVAADDDARRALLAALLDTARASGFSSLHVLFAPPAQIDAMRRAGMLVRNGVQFHWRNAGYATFDDFLAALAQPKRKKIRAERRHVHEAGVTLARKSGAEITAADLDFLNRCYRTTYAAHGSTPYLTRAFFHELAAHLADRMLLVLAYRGKHPIAAAFAMFDERTLWGRHWGAVEHVSCLHFECCYYQMIEFAIERGIAVFEGGAQGAHKMARGLDPVRTQSAHWFADSDMHTAVARFLARETPAIDETIDELNEHRAWRDRPRDE